MANLCLPIGIVGSHGQYVIGNHACSLRHLGLDALNAFYLSPLPKNIHGTSFFLFKFFQSMEILKNICKFQLYRINYDNLTDDGSATGSLLYRCSKSLPLLRVRASWDYIVLMFYFYSSVFYYLFILLFNLKKRVIKSQCHTYRVWGFLWICNPEVIYEHIV